MDKWAFESVFDDSAASVFIIELVGEIDESDSSARDDTFSESGFGSSDCVINAEFFLIDFGFSGTTDFDNGDFALERSGAFIKLFPLVIGS